MQKGLASRKTTEICLTVTKGLLSSKLPSPAALGQQRHLFSIFSRQLHGSWAGYPAEQEGKKKSSVCGDCYWQVGMMCLPEDRGLDFLLLQEAELLLSTLCWLLYSRALHISCPWALRAADSPALKASQHWFKDKSQRCTVNWTGITY